MKKKIPVDFTRKTPAIRVEITTERFPVSCDCDGLWVAMMGLGGRTTGKEERCQLFFDEWSFFFPMSHFFSLRLGRGLKRQAQCCTGQRRRRGFLIISLLKNKLQDRKCCRCAVSRNNKCLEEVFTKNKHHLWA